MRKAFAMLAAAVLIALVAVPAAEGAGYGRGTFKGKADSLFDSNRPATPIEIQVKGSRVRVVKAVSFNFGLRERAIQGIGDAAFDIDGLPCMDDVGFKANRK